MAQNHVCSALSAFWLTCYDCPVPLLVHQDNLSRQQFPALSLCSRAPLDKALLVSTYLFSFYDYYPSRLTAMLGLHPLCTIYILVCGLLGLYHSRIAFLCFYFFAFLLGLQLPLVAISFMFALECSFLILENISNFSKNVFLE